MASFRILMPDPAQSAWLDTPDAQASRKPFDALRERYWERAQQFFALPGADAMVAAAREYVKRTIPLPVEGEAAFWQCSCLPSRSFYGSTDFIRININWQETFCIFGTVNETTTTVYMARTPLIEQFGDDLAALPQHFPDVEVTDRTLAPGGHDQVKLYVTEFDAVPPLLRNADVRRAVRLFNLRLLNRGPCPYAHFHNPWLADRLLE